jgi:hypothetical protein
LERIINQPSISGTSVSDLDPVRVKWSGTGFIRMEEAAQFLIHDDTILGIETFSDCSDTTSLTLSIIDQAALQIGNEAEPGGVLQIGNTTCIPDATINFNLIINGNGAEFQINRRGMFGAGVGIANKLSSVPNNWLVGCLDNVNSVAVSVADGIFRHNQIFSGDSDQASLLAIGPSDDYTFVFDLVNSAILGGGNMILLENCITNTCDTSEPRILGQSLQQGSLSDQEYMKVVVQKAEEMILKTDEILKQLQQLLMRDFSGGGLSVAPTVTSFAGQTNTNVQANIFSSKDMLCDFAQPSQPVGVTPSALFAYLQALPTNAYASPKSTIAQNTLNQLTFGYVAGTAGTTIFRTNYSLIIGSGGNFVPPGESLQRGDVYINIDDATGDINNVTEIPFGVPCG